MRQLIHNGVLVPKYEAKGFSIKFRGKIIKLTPEQEEMAVAWVKKLGTQYVEDQVFVKNFFIDFCKALNIDKAEKDDFDFSEIQKYIEEEKEAKLKMTKEEKKMLAEQRKKIREANKQKYGHAIVDGNEVELATYMTEPSSIFMGRGKHPLRGRWKQGPKEEDIIINISPDAPRPPGKWKEIVWYPDFMWVARWNDKLTGKEKYIWLSDTSFIKQNREIEKFNKAIELGKKYNLLLKHIKDNLTSPDLKTRKIATVCYLIDALSMRVGDEKDKDEADTVGATTLTTKNVTIKENNVVEFDFLGKDSVRWQKEIELPEQVVKNLKEFISEPGKNNLIFNGIRSEHVNEFLSSIVPGISAKVFRTYHATKTVNEYLEKTKLERDDTEDKKYIATMANLKAAIVCNHKRTLPKNWKISLEKKIESLEKLKKQKIEAKKKLESKLIDRINKINQKIIQTESKIKDWESKKSKDWENRVKKAKESLSKLKRQKLECKTNMEKQIKEKMDKYDQKIRAAEIKVKIAKETKDYNLNTSLKSYIDPRVFYSWCQKIGYDWKKIYSKTLQRKFSWVEK